MGNFSKVPKLLQILTSNFSLHFLDFR